MASVHSATAASGITGVVRRLASRLDVKEAISAGLSSIAAGVIDLVILVTLVQRGVPVAVAAFIAAAAGAVVDFVCSKYLAFCDRTPLRLRQALCFAGVSLAGALFIALTIQLFAVGLGVPYVLAKLSCSTLVFAAWTYPAQRHLVFRKPTGSSGAALERRQLGTASMPSSTRLLEPSPSRILSPI